jgi:hypothetical protein
MAAEANPELGVKIPLSRGTRRIDSKTNARLCIIDSPLQPEVDDEVLEAFVHSRRRSGRM